MSDSGKGKTTPATASGSGKAASGDASNVIAFICPECERRLTGPARLQGKPGKCPHCEAKFIIPSYDEEDEEQEPLEAEQPGPEQDYEIDEPEVRDEQFGPVGEGNLYSEPAGPEPEAEFFPPPAEDSLDAGEMHPLARLFIMLWQEKEHGGLIEIHLSEGVMITPDWWAQQLSWDSHAVFAIQAPDGSYVMETIPWDNVKRITVRRIRELPGGVFE